ncbi:MAG: class I SAM-dependent methyltransferase [Aequoribacter sp.]|uniref:class I SAM-dependent methyltransferase n=1 Tax=Aequoribacter sp. TaxID=2847771 RepID=UPI003C40FEC9
MLLFKQRFSDLFENGKHVLHFAPEPCITNFLSSLSGVTHDTTDLVRNDVSFKADIQSLDVADASYGGVICAHVLQDVPDEAKATREVLRVLQPGGWALFSVPIRGAVTRECDQPMSVRAAWDKRPDEFIRVYGLDFAGRLQSCGFEVEVIEAKSCLSTSDALVKHGLANQIFTNVLFFCKKPDQG